MQQYTVIVVNESKSKERKRKCSLTENNNVVNKELDMYRRDASIEVKKKTLEVADRMRETLGLLVGVLPIIYVIINYIFNWSYQKKCSAFYNIPERHFTTSVSDLIMCVLGIVCLYFIPLLWKRWSENNMSGWLFVFSKWVLGVCFGTIIGATNLSYLMEVHEECKILGNNIFVKTILGIVIILMTILLMSSFVLDGYCNKSKKGREVMAAVLAIVFVFSVLITGCSVFSKLYPDLSQKITYEIVDYEGDKYFVLSENKGKLLVVSYKDKGGGVCELITDQYRIINEEKCVYSIVKLKTPPVIGAKKDVEDEPK